MRVRKFKGIVLVAVMLTAASSLAREIPPTEWPLERIIANLEAQIAAAPDDGDAQYNLGRAHAFAFALERSTLWAVCRDGCSVNALEDQARRDAAASKRLEAARPTPAELLEHLTKGVSHLLRSCELHATYGYMELTTAWLLETGAHLASRVDTRGLFALGTNELSNQDVEAVESLLASVTLGSAPVFPRELLRSPMLEKAASYCATRSISSQALEQARIDALLQRFWLEQSLRHYRLALEKENSLPVVREAVGAYRRLVDQRGPLDEEEAAHLSKEEERLARLEQENEREPRAFAATPVLVTLECKPLDELVTPNLAVPFDLDGDGIDELWPWLAPDAGWLVWDPHHRGEVTSGQQLFGSASGWLFFEDGYRVLDALDDDRDGELRGAELDGIAVWFDRNTNGISDRGEVVPVAELGIAALSTQSALSIGQSPANLCGAELADGRVLPTYDWVLAPAAIP